MDVRGERTGRRWFICNQLDMIRVEGLSASEHLCMWSRARGTGKQDTCRMRSRERGCRERNTGARRAGNSRMLWIIFVGILSAMSIWGFERISSFGVAVSTYSLCQSHLQTKKNRSPDCFSCLDAAFLVVQTLVHAIHRQPQVQGMWDLTWYFLPSHS